MLPTYILNQIKDLSLKHPYEECGGFIITHGDPFLFPCENKSKDRAHFFTFDAYDYIKASKMGTIWGLYHSHTNNSLFSKVDIDTCKRENLSLVLYVIKKNKFKFLLPESHDYTCINIVQEYYKKNYNKILDFTTQDYQNKDLLASKYGFIKTLERKKGNIIIFSRHNKYHLGIILNPKQFLHFSTTGVCIDEIPEKMPYDIYEVSK